MLLLSFFEKPELEALLPRTPFPPSIRGDPIDYVDGECVG